MEVVTPYLIVGAVVGLGYLWQETRRLRRRVKVLVDLIDSINAVTDLEAGRTDLDAMRTHGVVSSIRDRTAAMLMALKSNNSTVN